MCIDSVRNYRRA